VVQTGARRASASTVRSARRVEISIVLPCLNEEETVGQVVDEAWRGIRRAGVAGEVIVVDNDSTDGSAQVAAQHGARVLSEPRHGYGNAYLAGLDAAEGDYVVLADADLTYPLEDVDRLVAPLRDGKDLVLGSRLRGTIEPGAMPWSHRWIGNPLLTGLLNLLFRTGVSDAHCGLRAIRRDALPRLDLRTSGMEFASEMVVKAARRGLRIGEVPITYRARGGVSKLSRFSDAWRHIRFLLLQSPTFLFLVPGLMLFLLGLLGVAALAGGPVHVFGRTWEIHTAMLASGVTLVGAQIVQLGVFARTYAVLYLGESDPALQRVWRHVRLETGLYAGGALFLGGCGLLLAIVVHWAASDFGALHEEYLSLLALTFVGLGVQTVFGSFFLSILGLGRRDTGDRAR
jgi:glycosyltransferase involved in cell wall biosynthesis